MQASSETVAGDDAADGQDEEGEADGQHGDVEHWMLRAKRRCVYERVLAGAA
jgi:hypothetical protein